MDRRVRRRAPLAGGICRHGVGHCELIASMWSGLVIGRHWAVLRVSLHGVGGLWPMALTRPSSLRCGTWRAWSSLRTFDCTLFRTTVCRFHRR